MRYSTPDHAPNRLTAFRRVIKSPPRMALAGALAVLCVVAAACGGGSTVTTDAGDPAPSQAAPDAPSSSASSSSSSIDFEDTRPGAGIAAAEGSVQAVRGADPCTNPDSAADDPFTITYVGVDLSELALLGFESVVVDDPSNVIAAYVNETNFHGGIRGRCVELDSHLWSLTDPVTSYIEVCAHMAEHDPLFYFSFQLYDSGLSCATFGTAIPVVGLYTARPESAFAEERHLLHADDGAVEHILARSLEVGLTAGVIDNNTRIGLLHGTGPSAGLGIAAAEAIVRLSDEINLVATADVPREFGDLELLLSQSLSDDEHEELHGDHAAVHDELVAVTAVFYADAAARFRDAEVTAVVTTAHWADVRRFMRAADSIDWTPTWLTNDMQPATLTTADAPARQVQNLRQVSARRAAGDVVPRLDQGCVTLRNTASGAEPFNHRPHTDAWNLIMSICDYLDVSFSALTRINGTITHESFLEALNDTHYEAPYGGLITFSESDGYGADRFRVLQTDSGCVLNYWGCMRATTDWLDPEHLHEHEIREIDLGEHGHEDEAPADDEAPTDDEAPDAHEHE